VAIVAESFLPQTNGVVNSILRLCDYLAEHGHEALLIVPDDRDIPARYAGFEVVTVTALPFPLYTEVKVGLAPSFVVERLLADWAPDVVHAAAPLVIGQSALSAAARLSLPTVAVYQTDVPSFTHVYGFGFLESVAWAYVRQLHNLATLTLAPSSAARDQLIEHGVPRVAVWGRGVDVVRFDPAKRDPSLHAAWAPGGEVVVGFMGRLAPEKRVDDLAVVAGLPGVRLVVVGEGPSEKALRAALPEAIFTGKLTGDALAAALASMDVFAHTGLFETFGQTLQEALASGLPVVAPAQGGPLDIVTPGVNGFLYEPGDLESLRGHVERLVRDAGLRAELGRAGRAGVETRTWPHLCAELMGYYEEVRRPLLTGEVGVDPR